MGLKMFVSNLYNYMATQAQTTEIDARGQAVGRIATQAAMILQGKHKADYQPHILNTDKVRIVNAKLVNFSGRKLEQKDFYHHTMYPGGLRRTPLKKLFEKDPTEIMRRAVYKMLPKNKLRNDMMKRLEIVE